MPYLTTRLFASLFSCCFILAAMSPAMAAPPKMIESVLVVGELANGLDFSIYPSDDRKGDYHEEDVSILLYVGIGTDQQTAQQIGAAAWVGGAAGDIFYQSGDDYTNFQLNINGINDQKFADGLMAIKNIASGEFYTAANLNNAEGEAFVSKWYQAKFMHLVVAGRIDVAKAKAQIEALFGGLKSSDILRASKTTKQAPALSAPPEGLTYVATAEGTPETLRILLSIPDRGEIGDAAGSAQQFWAQIVIGLEIRATLRNESYDTPFEYFSSYEQYYDGQAYIEIEFRPHGQPVKTTKWIIDQLANLRKKGITEPHLSGFHMWILAEGIDHFSPFKPDGKPSDLTFSLGDGEHANQYAGGAAANDYNQASYFRDHMDYKKLDKLSDLMLSGKMRILTIQPHEISAAHKQQLEKLIDDYNKRRK